MAVAPADNAPADKYFGRLKMSALRIRLTKSQVKSLSHGVASKSYPAWAVKTADVTVAITAAQPSVAVALADSLDLCVPHRAAAMRREPVSVDPDDVDIARPQRDTFAQYLFT